MSDDTTTSIYVPAASGDTDSLGYWRLGTGDSDYDESGTYAYTSFTDHSSPTTGMMLYTAGDQASWIAGARYVRIEGDHRTSSGSNSYHVTSAQHGGFAKQILLKAESSAPDVNSTVTGLSDGNIKLDGSNDIDFNASNNVSLTAGNNFSTSVSGQNWTTTAGTSVTYNAGTNTLTITTGFAMTIFLGMQIDMAISTTMKIALSISLQIVVGGKVEIFIGSSVSVSLASSVEIDLIARFDLKASKVSNILATVFTGGVNVLAAAVNTGANGVESKNVGVLADANGVAASTDGIKSRIAGLYSIL